jgi:very-short-patch-repair endonuclease
LIESPEIVPRIPAELTHVVDDIATGGSICALYSQHRVSVDIDFVVRSLREQFDEVRERLLEQPGWREARIRAPNFIAGSLDQIEVGFRQQRRQTPIETREVETPEGKLVIPTLEELLRIKALLAYERNYTRDFFDFAELASLLPREAVIDALLAIDAKLGWERQPTVLLEVTKALAHCEPRDLETHGFETFRLLNPKLKSWDEARAVCREIGRLLAERAIGGSTDDA